MEPVTHPVLAAARLLGPQIQARSAEIEALGALPPDLVDTIRPTGAFRQCVPDDLGGPGVTVNESLRVFEEFAYHDGSVGLVRGHRFHDIGAGVVPSRSACRRPVW